jgi:hypothetical protein
LAQPVHKVLQEILAHPAHLVPLALLALPDLQM